MPSRYSPSVALERKRSPFATLAGAGIGFLVGGPKGALTGAQLAGRASEGDLAGAVESYMTTKRQEKLDKIAEEELAYKRERRETLDPLEDALVRAQLYEKGVVPRSASAGPGLADVIESDRGADLLSGRARFGDRGFYMGTPAVGVNAPGSFNPVTGTFNTPSIDPGFTVPRLGPQREIDPGFTAPRIAPERDIDPGFTAPQRRIPLGGDYELDPSLTQRGREEARERELIDAYMQATGKDRAHATVDVRGVRSEELHPGPYHPRTMAEALGFLRGELGIRGPYEERLARIRADSRKNTDRDPQWEERRKGWAKELGDPTNRLQQDILDALADGDEPGEILDDVPRSQQAEAQRYLRRAIRRRRRATGAVPSEEE